MIPTETLFLGPLLVGLAVGLTATFTGVWSAGKIYRFWRKMKWRELPRRERVKVIFSYSVWAGILACAGDAWLIEPGWVETTHVRIPAGRAAPLRIVHISDLHIDAEGEHEKRLAERVNSLRPDVVVMTGDYANAPSGCAALKRVVGPIQAAHKVAVLGNWDTPASAEALEEAGFTVLQDGACELKDERIVIAGLSYRSGKTVDQIVGASAGLFTIALHHAPEGIERFGAAHPDLFLCGHTHGGQVRLPFYGAILTMSKFGKKYEAGLYEEGAMRIYVNRGYGVSGAGPRVRFFCRPEITLIELARP